VAIAGTVTVDPATGAFEFIGADGGPQDGTEIAGRLDIAVLVRSAATGGTWRAAVGDGIEGVTVAAVVDAVRTVADATGVTEILTDAVRERYVSLVAVEEIADDPLGPTTRYDLEIDTERFADEFPLRWRAFTTGAIPGAGRASPLPVSVRLTTDQVLVAVDADAVGWSWRRVAWSADPFVPAALIPDPSTYTIRAACTSEDGTVFWQTTFASCDEALAIARDLAAQTGATTALVEAGVVEAELGSRIDRTVARLCAAVENPAELTPVEVWEAQYGSALVNAAVCVGDVTVLVP
jgi:hypothetical protein